MVPTRPPLAAVIVVAVGLAALLPLRDNDVVDPDTIRQDHDR